MTGWPVPAQYGISTPYGKRGGSWSCDDHGSGGVHTGADFACPEGTPLYATVAGEVRHRSYGSAFGSHQFAISPDPDQPFADGEVFYAHARKRLADGTRVAPGDWVGEAGEEGNATGPHLHYEFHPHSKGAWNCSVHADPEPTLATVSHGLVYLSKLVYGQDDSDSVRRLQMHLNGHSLDGGETLPVTGFYGDQTDEEVRLCQVQHGFGSDPAGGSSVGPKQAAHLFTGCGCSIVDDLGEPDAPPEQGGGAVGQVWHDYSGKPGGTLTIQGSADYVKVDASAADAPGDGLEFHMLYANLDLTWSGSGDGTIRVKYVREGGDATGYQDYTVANGRSDFLIQPIHWEAGEKGVGGDWYINVGGGISKAVVGTRYVKAGGVLYG